MLADDNIMLYSLKIANFINKDDFFKELCKTKLLQKF